MADIGTSKETVAITVVASFPLPSPNLSRLIWQPVTKNVRQPNENCAMRLAPLSWQPSGAHHALEFLAQQVEALSRDLEAMRAERDAAVAREQALQARVAELTKAIEEAIDAGKTELNLGNYYHDDVCALQAEALEIWAVLTAALSQEGEE